MRNLVLFLLFASAAWGQTPVRPLFVGSDGIPSQVGNTTYIQSGGHCFNSACTLKIEANGSNQLGFKDLADSFVAFDDVALAAFAARYTLTFQHNGTVGNGTFYGYSNLLSGDSTPVLIPVNSILKGFSYSNRNSSADYALEFRRNTTGGAAFYTTPNKVNVQFFTETIPDQTFNAGDQIYIKHIDQGGNASDAAIVIFLQVIP